MKKNIFILFLSAKALLKNKLFEVLVAVINIKFMLSKEYLKFLGKKLKLYRISQNNF